MSDVKVRILLDVDGVLNAVTRDIDYSIWPDWKVTICDNYPILHSATVGKRLEALSEIPGVEILWCTTWKDNANRHIRQLFGWEPFGVVQESDPNRPGWWKLHEVRALWEDTEVPFVWIDDDLRYVKRAKEWLMTLDPDSFMAVAPMTAVGLTDFLLYKIEEFVAEKVAA